MYLKKHIGGEAYNKLTPEQKANIDAIDAAIKAAELKPELKAALEGLDFDALKAFKTDSEEFRDAIKSLSAKVESLKASDPTTGKKDELVEALKAADEVIKAICQKSFSGNTEIGKFKASTITTGYAFDGSSYVPTPYRIQEPFVKPLANLNILQFANVIPSTATPDGTQDVVVWTNESSMDGGDADYTAEGVLKNKVSWTYNTETSTAKTITAFVKVSTKMLRNASWFANRIRTRLVERLEQKREEELINGAGTTELTGITEYAPGFTTTEFNDSVKDPQTADVLVCMAGQIEQLDFMPTVAMLNPADIRKMKLVKDANGQYVLPPFSTTNGTYIDNLQVVPNMKIAKGYALVGDLSKFNVSIPEDITIIAGMEKDDLTLNLRTVLAETTINCFVSANELGAFCYDSIATVKMAIAEIPTV